MALFWLARLRGATPEPAVAPDGQGSERVDVRFHASTSEYIQANLALGRRSTSNRILSGLLALAAVAMLAIGSPQTAVPIALLAGLLVSGVWMIPIVWWMVRQRPDLVHAELEFHADAEGIRFGSPYGVTDATWSTFRRLFESSGFVYFEVGVGATIFVPRRVFGASELGTLYRLADRAGLISGRRR